MPFASGRRSGRLACAVLVVLAAASVGLPAANAMGSIEARTIGSGPTGGALLVQWQPGVGDSQIAGALANVGGIEIGRRSALRTSVVSVRPIARRQTRAALLANPAVAAVEVDRPTAAAGQGVVLEPDDPHWAAQWGARVVGARGAWALTAGSKSVVIAALDTGVDGRQPDLSGA